MTVPLIEGSVPDGLALVRLQVTVAGQTIVRRFAGARLYGQRQPTAGDARPRDDDRLERARRRRRPRPDRQGPPHPLLLLRRRLRRRRSGRHVRGLRQGRGGGVPRAHRRRQPAGHGLRRAGGPRDRDGRPRADRARRLGPRRPPRLRRAERERPARRRHGPRQGRDPGRPPANRRPVLAGRRLRRVGQRRLRRPGRRLGRLRGRAQRPEDLPVGRRRRHPDRGLAVRRPLPAGPLRRQPRHGQLPRAHTGRRRAAGRPRARGPRAVLRLRGPGRAHLRDHHRRPAREGRRRRDQRLPRRRRRLSRRRGPRGRRADRPARPARAGGRRLAVLRRERGADQRAPRPDPQDRHGGRDLDGGGRRERHSSIRPGACRRTTSSSRA